MFGRKNLGIAIQCGYGLTVEAQVQWANSTTIMQSNVDVASKTGKTDAPIVTCSAWLAGSGEVSLVVHYSPYNEQSTHETQYGIERGKKGRAERVNEPRRSYTKDSSTKYFCDFLSLLVRDST